MHKYLSRILAISAASVLVQTTIARGGSYCDLSWVAANGSQAGVSAAPSANGHVVALRGTDGIIRLNEWQTSSSTWSGWIVLPSQNDSLGDPWVQYISNPGGTYNGTSIAGQNVYARGKTFIYQWICTRSGNSWVTSQATPVISILDGSGNKVISRVASAQINASTPYGGEQELFATFSNGTVKYRKWTPWGLNNGSWNDTWTDMGISGVQGAPYAIQLSPTTVNLYVHQADGSIRQNYWNGSSWSGWLTPDGSGSIGYGDVASTFATYHYLYSFSTNGNLESEAYTGGSWTAWTTYASPIKKSLAPVKTSGFNGILYGIDANNAVWSAVFNGSSLTSSAPVNCQNVLPDAL